VDKDITMLPCIYFNGGTACGGILQKKAGIIEAPNFLDRLSQWFLIVDVGFCKPQKKGCFFYCCCKGGRTCRKKPINRRGNVVRAFKFASLFFRVLGALFLMGRIKSRGGPFCWALTGNQIFILQGYLKDGLNYETAK